MTDDLSVTCEYGAGSAPASDGFATVNAVPSFRAQPGRLTVHEILAATAQHFGLTRADITDGGRYRRFSVPRQIVMYLARELTSASYPLIVRVLNLGNHTTAIYGRDEIARRIEMNPTLAADVSAIRAAIIAASPIPDPVESDMPDDIDQIDNLRPISAENLALVYRMMVPTESVILRDLINERLAGPLSPAVRSAFMGLLADFDARVVSMALQIKQEGQR